MIDKNENKKLAVINILSFILVIVLNSLAVILPLNGKSTRQLSDQYPNLFTPAGITFSIWGLIYLFLAGFIIFQGIVLFRSSNDTQKKMVFISRPFIVSCLANASWILAWHYEQVLLSVVIMLVLLVSLVIIYERLQLPLPAKPLGEKLLSDLPFSLYLGWISIATIANITAFLVSIGWSGAGISASWWTVIMIVVGTLLNVYMVLFKNNITFGLVGTWAFYGILLKNQGNDDEIVNHVIFCTQICISIIVLSIIIQSLKYWNKTADSGLTQESIKSEAL